jgi:hypothetical protein
MLESGEHYQLLIGYIVIGDDGMPRLERINSDAQQTQGTQPDSTLLEGEATAATSSGPGAETEGV